MSTRGRDTLSVASKCGLKCLDVSAASIKMSIWETFAQFATCILIQPSPSRVLLSVLYMFLCLYGNFYVIFTIAVSRVTINE